MDSEVIFQLTASIIASIFCGASLAFWLLSIDAMSLQRLSKEPLISSQAVIGGFVFLGSITSVFLALLAADPKYGKLLSMLKSVSSLITFQICLSGCYSWKLIVCFFCSFWMRWEWWKQKKSNTDLCQYLSVSTLQHWLAHIVSALLFVGTVAILLFSMAFSVRLTSCLPFDIIY